MEFPEKGIIRVSQYVNMGFLFTLTDFWIFSGFMFAFYFGHIFSENNFNGRNDWVSHSNIKYLKVRITMPT